MATFYVLVGAQGLSLVGSQTSALAVGIAVFRLTGHATPLALVSVFWAVPRLLLGGFGGALADRLDRRRLMLIANLGYTVANGLLLVAFLAGAFQVWELYALTLATSSFGLIEVPALQASVAMLAPDAHRDRANAIQQLTYPTAVVLAGAFAGLLYASVGVTGAIVVDLGTFLAAIAVLALVRIPMPTPSGAARPGWGGLWRQSLDGFAYLAGRPPLLALCIYIALIGAIAGGLFWALMTPYALGRLGSASAYGFTFAVGFTGAIAGSLTMAAWGGTRPRMTTVIVGTLLAGAGVALTGVARGPVTLATALFLLTFAIPFANVATMSIFQAKIAPERQGRAFAAMGQLTALLAPLTSLAGGPLADRIFEPAVGRPGWALVAWLVGAGRGAGIGLIYVIGGLAIIALTLALLATPAVRQLEATLPDQPSIPNT